MRRYSRGSCLLPIGCFLLGVLTGLALIVYLLYQWLFAGDAEDPLLPEAPAAITQSSAQ